MLDIAPSELLLCAIVALVVIGPKDLPRALRFAGKWLGKARKMGRHFNAGIDNIIREAELQDLKKEWSDHNRRIMEQFPNVGDYSAIMPENARSVAVPSAPVESPVVDPQPPAVFTGLSSTPMPAAPVQLMPDWPMPEPDADAAALHDPSAPHGAGERDNPPA